MSLHIDHPAWLLLSLLGVLSAALGWRVMQGIPRGRRLMAVTARALLLIALGLAMSGVYRVQEADDLTVIGVVDVSGSVREFADFGVDESGQPNDIGRVAAELLERLSAGKREGDRLGIIAFDGLPSVVASPARAVVLDRVIEKMPIDGSDLPEAISAARSMVPLGSNARLLVISDGRSTTPGLDRIPGDIQIDVVPIRYDIDREVVVESMDVPTRALPGAEIEARVVLRSLSESTGELRISDNGEPVDLNGDEPGTGMRVSLSRGQRVLMVPMTLGAGRVHRFEARYIPDELEPGAGVFSGDTSLRNNRVEAVTLTRSRGRVLIVSPLTAGENRQSAELERVLDERQWETEWRLPDAFPRDLLDLEAFDLVVLVNTARDALPVRSDELLAAYVNDLGGGVIFVGGNEALGAGGWQGSAVEEILPVKLDVPDDMIVPQVAVVVVLDASGSMKRTIMGSSQSQQRIANNSAAEAFEVLDERDLVGVVAFSSNAREVVPMGPNNRPEDIRARIASISSGGGTNIGAGLRLARQMLSDVEANEKHIVLLSDGESMRPEQLPVLADELGEMGIRVSTIAVGDSADERGMRDIAVRSKGVYYRVMNPSVLPQIFLKAIRVVRSPNIRVGRFEPVVLDPVSPATGALGRLPALEGLVLSTRIDDDPRVLTPIVTPEGEPVLAYRQSGLGRVAVFTSDVGRWASEWIASPVFSRFWGTLGAWAMRAGEESPGEMTITRAGNAALVEYEAYDESGAPIDGLEVELQIYDRLGDAMRLRMEQVGAGRYSARTPALSPGTQVLIASPTLRGEPMMPTIVGFEISGSSEYAHLDADPNALIDLARRTGGRVIELDGGAPFDLFSREGLVTRRSLRPVWTGLVAAALVLFLIDLAMRRVAFDRWVAKAREDTIAASRASAGQQLQRAFEARKRARASAAQTPEIVRKRMQRPGPRPNAKPKPTPPAQPDPRPEPGADEPVSDNPLLAAKRRAREQFDKE